MHRIPLSLVVGLAIMALAWLVPNHYPPWLSFHGEFTAAVGFAVFGLASIGSGRAGPVAWPRLAALALALAAVPLVQAATGRVFFWGDAWMASLYLVGLALAMVVGHRLPRQHAPQTVLPIFWLAVLVAGVLSVGVALCQWLGLPLGLLGADMPPWGRPFANLAQPNHLATLLGLSLVAAFALAQQGLIGCSGLVAAVPFLLVGMALTGSRAGVLQVGALALWLLLMHGRASLRVSRQLVWSMPALFVLAVLALPRLGSLLSGGAGRSAAEQAQAGTRPIHWASMIDAVAREPLFGHGWNQVSVAQARVATDHPGSGEMIEHSHNLLLDLLVWNGIPLGLLVVIAIAWWIVRQLRACRDPQVAWLLAGTGVILLHALVEFPLDYSYFLLPLGLMMGMAQALSPAGAPTWQAPRWVTAVPAVAALAVLGWTAMEYVQLEETHRLSRFEAARIANTPSSADTPLPALLTQQRAFLEFTRQKARRHMTGEQLEAMRRVAERYGYPPVLLRYALAAGLNGRPAVAASTLQRLCKTHPAARCREGAQAWQEAIDGEFPELRPIAYPPVPPAPQPRR